MALSKIEVGFLRRAILAGAIPSSNEVVKIGDCDIVKGGNPQGPSDKSMRNRKYFAALGGLIRGGGTQRPHCWDSRSPWRDGDTD